MKLNKYIIYIGVLVSSLSLTSCNDFLDREPLDKVTPDAFFQTDQHLADYTIGRYSFPVKGGWGIGYLGNDAGTDNMVSNSANLTKWVPERQLTSQGGSIDFGSIRSANYFFSKVLPKYEAGAIQGSLDKIKHYIGEMYFLRASAYFSMLKSYGDFPILKEVLPDDEAVLVKHSKREPRNEVARSILDDLDQAIELMTNENSIVSNKNRLSKNAALLLKSRVALYEGSWLKYHAGTDRVPNGPNWPGAVLHPDYQFPSGGIDAESKYFLTEAVNSSKELLSIPLQDQGEGRINPEPTSTNPFGWNSYYEMFTDIDMSKYSEVILWKQNSVSQSVMHPTSLYLRIGGDYGLTRGFVDSFVMSDGKPVYASSDYKGDTTFEDVMADRDARLQLFMLDDSDRDNIEKAEIPGVQLASTFKDRGSRFPDIIRLDQNGSHFTGYALRKGLSYDPRYNVTGGMVEDSGSLVYRATEAYLNFIEASYMLNNTLTSEARQVWGQIRKRAGLTEASIDVTIQNTDLTQDAKNDWGVYSSGKTVDATLYSIRRERRCELIGEGFRWDDLYRWASLNQVRDYIEEGFNLWDENYKRYYSEEGKLLLIEPGIEGMTPNTSAKTDGKYLRPFRIFKDNNEVYNGYSFRQAKYLSPVPIRHIELASPTGSVESSNFYQNPGWPLTGNSPAIKSNDPLDN